jgi:hypothetical protein
MADADTQPIPAVVAEPADPAAEWLLALFDRQARLNAQVEVSGFRGLTDADLALMNYIPGSTLSPAALELLKQAGLGGDA